MFTTQRSLAGVGEPAASKPPRSAVTRRLRSLLVVAVAGAALVGVGAHTAAAGTYGPTGCMIHYGNGCRTTEHHTYNDAGAYAPNASWAYIGSWITSDAGTARAVSYGYGSTYAYYRDNTGTFFWGWWYNAQPNTYLF